MPPPVLQQAQIALGAGETVIYTVPVGDELAIDPGGLIACNVSGGGTALTLHVRIGGAAAGPATRVINAEAIAVNTNSALAAELRLRLSAGDIISGFGTLANDITVTMTGIEGAV